MGLMRFDWVRRASGRSDTEWYGCSGRRRPPTSAPRHDLDETSTMDGGEVLRLVRIRCRVVDADRRGLVIARDVDSGGRVHFVVLQPVSGGRQLKYAVDPYTGKLVEPPVIEP